VTSTKTQATDASNTIRRKSVATLKDKCLAQTVTSKAEATQTMASLKQQRVTQSSAT
jgi:hypothetical protein